MYTKTKITLHAIAILSFSAVLFSQPLSISWQKIFGTEDLEGGKTEDIPAQILQTKDGSYVITGETQGTDGADIPAGMYVAKLTRIGTLAWIKFPAGDKSSYDAHPNIFNTTSDGGFIFAGKKYFSLGLTKIDEDAKVTWNRKYDLDNVGNFLYVTEKSDKNFTALLQGYGDSTSVLLVVDKNGNVISVKKLSKDIDGFTVGSVSSTRDGGFILAGTRYLAGYDSGSTSSQDVRVMKLDGEGNIVWDRSFGGNKQDFGRYASETSDGGFIIAACSSSFNARNQWDYYVIRIDMNGNKVWEKNFGATDTNYIRACYEAKDGGYVCGGTHIGKTGSRYYVIKLDNNGERAWEKLYGDEKLNLLMHGFIVTNDGGYAMIGQLENAPAIWIDNYVVKTDNKGNTGKFPRSVKSVK
jgi:hypothetical protein